MHGVSGERVEGLEARCFSSVINLVVANEMHIVGELIFDRSSRQPAEMGNWEVSAQGPPESREDGVPC